MEREPQEISTGTREILSEYPRTAGRFYHGCPENVDRLLPSDDIDKTRPGEEDRRSFKDVVFLTSNFDKASDYAGPEGVVFAVDATATQYRPVAARVLNTKKTASVQSDVYIALPEDVKIVAKWHKEKGRKRGEPQKYVSEYIGEQEGPK